MKAFIFDPLWDDLVTQELLDKLQAANIEIVVTKDMAPLSDCKELFEGDEDRLLCMNPDYVDWKLPSDVYKGIPHLKAILTASTAFGWLDTTYATEQNIPVCNIRNFATEAVAEWAILIMLNLARRVPEIIKNGFPLDFGDDYVKYHGIELHDKTVGIVGMGHIGQAIAKRCQGFGMQVTYWSQNSRDDNYEFKELEALFSESNVIVPLMAINPQTKTIITNALLDSMKHEAMLIDVVDGLFDHDHALELVKQGKLYGYGFEGKPGEFGKHEGNIWAAPPYAWTTDRSMFGTVERWVDNIVQAASENFPNKIN